jgi:signal transduction histidine kinase
MTRTAIAGTLRRLWPRRVRARLAVLYALLFLVAGLALLALTYALLASRLPAPANTARPALARNDLTLCERRAKSVPPAVSIAVMAKCKLAFAAGVKTGSTDQRDRTLSSLLDASLIGLGIATLASAGLGWLVSGRVLRPVRSITETARRASELALGERLALAGPDDELKELADTFDVMLERLDAAFTSQKRFVANAAHELRTPLTAMRTAIEVTLSKPNRTPEQLEAMAIRVKRSVQRAEVTVEALLTLATSELGTAAHEPVEISIAAEDALDAMQATIDLRRIEVEAALEPAHARGDRVLLERMIANLVENAVRHNHPAGWIGIRTIQQPDNAVFEIANTGPSVPAEQIPTLFEPFARAKQRLNPPDGVGLGLSIANAIARAHDATISARPRPGGGLEMSVAIPASRADRDGAVIRPPSDR